MKSYESFTIPIKLWQSNRLYGSTGFSGETQCMTTIGLSRNCFFILQLWSLTVLSQQDLEGKIIVDELRQDIITTNSKAEPPQCTSLAWSADGQVGLLQPFLPGMSSWTCNSSVTELMSCAYLMPVILAGAASPLIIPNHLKHLKPYGDSPANMRG